MQPVLRLLALSLIGLGALSVQAASPALVEPALKPEALAVSTPEGLAVDPAQYTSQTFDWNDAPRARNVPAKLYLPTGPL